MTAAPQHKHVTIVCCHAIWAGPTDGYDADGTNAGLNDSEWVMEPFQAGEGVTFRQHVLEGIRIAREHGGELWFSGGCTKRSRTPLSEGGSYRDLCDILLARHPQPPTSPTPLPFTVHVDPFATDSLQNIVFPLLQSPTYRSSFLLLPSPPAPSSSASASVATIAAVSINSSSSSACPGPTRLTIVSHAFKRARFLSLHLPALGLAPAWIAAHVCYVGVDPPGAEEEGPKRAAFEAGERRAREMWNLDPWGVVGDVLAGKRRSRGWDEDGARRAGEEMLRAIGEGDEVGEVRGEVKDFLEGRRKELDVARLLSWNVVHQA